MKHFMLRNLMLFSLLCSTLGVNSVWAQLTHGKVYNFANVGQTGKSLVIESDTKLIVATTDDADTKQQWYAEEVSTGIFALRNMHNGKYLKSPNATGNASWTTVLEIEDNCKLVCKAKGSNYTFRANNTSDGYHYLHYSSAAYVEKVVCWETSSTSSQWTFTEVAYNADVLGEILEEFDSKVPSKIATNLAYFFEDVACTKVKSTFTSEAEIEASAAYKALPDALRNMVKKVYNQSWTENNYDSNKSAWDNDYAKKYRVQWYEPYTEPECAASALRINAHTNLNNPTGIFANSGDVLFVMVEGEIKEGAYLYLSNYTGHGKLGGYRDGTELHTGLNVIPVTADSTNYCINYVVKTFDTSKGTGKKAIIEGRELSKYPDLQIHIEGGYINGYWNKMGDNATHKDDFNYPADNDADWDYIKARATQTDVTVLGEYVTLQFPLTDEGTGDDKGMGTFFNSYGGKTTSLEASIEEWDNVMIWERLLMGVLGKDVIAKEDKKSPYSNQPKVTAYTGDDTDDFGCDYSEYYRVHGLSFGTESNYMYGGWDHCGYNFNTMESIMLSIVDEAGSHWGPAHEIGHQHQGPLNMRGLTEVTNNLFSNVVLWYYGKSTSRYNGTDGSLSNVLQQFNADGTDFFSNNIWAQTIMYYKLFLYYHVLGNNPKFYPRLFEMLRQNPMAIEYNQDGGKCLMHFYKLCCDAAGEDLTEFFRAHGFFRVMEDRFVGDYSNAIYNMTQAQIDAAIAEVEAKDYPENIVVLFITDATGEGNIESNRDDVEYLTHFDTNNSVNLISGELGNYATFNTVAAPSYNYTVSGNTVTMEGTGGVGLAILNEKGELIGFSDKTTFEISDETMEALSNGSAKVVVMSATGEPVEATAAMSESEIKRTLLVELIAQAEALDALTDDTDGKKIGFYKSSYMTDLNNALTKAQEVVKNNTASAYTPVFNALKAAIDDLKSKEFAKITMKPGTYTVRNFEYTTRYLSVNGSNEVVTSTNAEPTDTEKWVFEQGDGNNVYYIKNLSTSKYVNALAQSTVVSATTSEIADAKGWLVEDLGNGVFGITCQDENNQAMHSAANASYKIVGWNTGSTASRWYLTALETEQLSAEQQELEELIALSEDMLERVANVETVKERVELNENSYYCNAPHKYGGDALTTYAVLYDNDYTTFLHTDYSGADSEDKLDHYLRVDLGDGNSASLFTFNYASRNSSNQNPTAITVEGCNEENGTYELITTLTRDADKLISGGKSEYHSAVMGLSSKSYRYLRFTVTGTIENETRGPEDNKHVYFVFSEFGVSKAICNVTVLPKYANATLTDKDVTDAFNTIREAKYAYANATQASDYTTAYNALKTYYDKLVEAYNTVDQTALTDKKAELQALINNTTTLIGECGEVTYTPAMFNGEAPLQVTDENGKFYLSTNAQSKQEGPISGLIDGVVGNKDSNTYFHTDYSGNNSTDDLDHYIQVKLGEKVKAFQFTYTNRHNTDKNYATKMTIWGSTDGTTFEEITRIEGLPASKSAVYTSEEINVTKEYTHLRFMVTESDNSVKKGGHHFFHMAEFDLTLIGGPESYTVQMNQNIGEVTEDLLLATYKENKEAESTLNFATTELQIIKAISDLQAQYDELETAMGVVDKAKDALRAEISKLEELIDKCRIAGTTIVPKEEDCDLQATSLNADFYISTNATDSEGDIANLVDGDMNSSFQTKMGVGDAHYLLVDAGADKTFKKFKFSYQTCNNPLPYAIEVEGSNDNSNFTELATFTKDDVQNPLPSSTNRSWTSSEIGDGIAYRYLRFNVTKSGVVLKIDDDKEIITDEGEQLSNKYKNALNATNAAASQSEYCFAMSNFDITNIVDEEQPTEILAGTVTEAQLNNATTAKDYAQMLVDESTNQADLSAKTAELQRIYEALYAAYGIQVSLATTLESRDKLLSNIEYGKTIGTFSAPYATVIPEGVTAYYAQQKYDGGTVSLTPIEKGEALPAEQGVILIGEAGVNSVTFYPATDKTEADLNENKFSNSAAASVVMENNDYILANPNGGQGIGFYKAKKGSTLNQYKAFFRLPAGTSASSFVLRFDGNTTDIDAVTTGTPSDNELIYDIYGRRVTEVKKGNIYIKNGKKFFVK